MGKKAIVTKASEIDEDFEEATETEIELTLDERVAALEQANADLEGYIRRLKTIVDKFHGGPEKV